MFKNLIFLFFAFVSPFITFSQQTDKLSYETGLVINKYFPKEKINTKLNKPLNYFFKIEYEGKTFSRGNWSLFVPIGISYSYYKVDYIQGFNTGTPYTLAVNVYHNFTLFAGPQLQYQRNQLRFCGALFLNNQYVSSRVFGLYHLKTRLWVGPSCEIFFYDVLYSFNEFKNKKGNLNYQRGKVFGLNGNAYSIYPGIKLQVDLKY